MTAPTERIQEAVARFAKERPLYDEAANLTMSEIRAISDAASLKCTYSARAKDVRSFHKKIVEKSYDSPWEQVTDKAGVRAIVDCPGDVDLVMGRITAKLGSRVLSIEDKRQVGRPETLGYSGVHLQIAVDVNGDALECEVQLRTGAQDLWSVMSHRLLYKPLVELPDKMQHAAYRLGALVELFDEELQRLIERERLEMEDPALRLVSLAEDAFTALAHSPSNRALSLLFIRPILSTFSPEEVAGYPALLAAFVDAERDALEDIYREYGAHSALAYLPDYLLLGQAESVILLERLSSHPHQLASAWTTASLPIQYLRALADAAGYDLPDE